MITRETILANHPIEAVARQSGIELKPVGGELVGKCIFHADKSPSLRINVKKQAWFCDPCGIGGSVIDFVAKRDNSSIGDAMKKLSGQTGDEGRPVELCRYDYTDEFGHVLFQVVRFVPKTFRQCHVDSRGETVWNMNGIRRVLYKLPAVQAADDVFIVEGEKDADELCRLGFCATTNVGGAKKWMDSYSDVFKGKNVILWADNDIAGKEHSEKVVKSLTGKAKTIFFVETQEKDAAEYIKAHGQSAQKDILDMLQKLKPMDLAADVPVSSMDDLEREYRDFVQRADGAKLSFSKWLPSLGANVRPLVQGELAVVLADTGVGKTAILQNIAYHARPMNVLIFEMELPGTLMFERFVQLQEQLRGDEVYSGYKADNPPDWRSAGKLSHVYTCTKSGITGADVKRIIEQSELKIGERPTVVLIDYIGLMGGVGRSRYERISNAAEEMKVIAKETNTIVVMASQVHRPDSSRDSAELFLHDAKDSGSVENSAGLMLGAWREDQGRTMKIKILKNTKGTAGKIIECNARLALMEISEKTK